jgi:eukaryotic-like serine/threonine-protein kinase
MLLVEPGSEQTYPMDWFPDGKSILYVKWGPSGPDIWVLPLQGDRKPYSFKQRQQTQTMSIQMTARFSPDGKWLAYATSESGKFEVYATPFPGPGGVATARSFSTFRLTTK